VRLKHALNSRRRGITALRESFHDFIWRKSLGQTRSGLAGDANGNNQVDAGDYNLWRANFGDAIGSGSLSASVPEPLRSRCYLCAAFSSA
jgi:hypothetical protein